MNASAKTKPSQHINNPDLIFVGQRILIPGGDNRRRTVIPLTKETGKTPAKDSVRLSSYKYELEKKVMETYLAGGFKATVTIKGAITLQSENSISWLEFNKDGYDINVECIFTEPDKFKQYVAKYPIIAKNTT